MREPGDERTLEQVLIDFEISCPRPTTEDVERLPASHPTHARAILRNVTLTSMEIVSGREAVEPRPDPRDEAFVSEMVDAHMASRRRRAQAQPLEGLLARAGMSLQDLEGVTAIHPGVLGAVMTEGLGGPVPRRLAREVASALGVSPEVAAASLAVVPSSSVWEHATSGRAPRRRLRTFAEAIRGSDMTDERKTFWLGDD